MRVDHEFEADPKSPRPTDHTRKGTGTREHDEAFGFHEVRPKKVGPEDAWRHVSC